MRIEDEPEKTAVLRFTQMIFRQKGTLTRRIIHAIIAIALRLFFRRIEVSGISRVPFDEPLIFVLNHPNGLIDPALVFVALPRRVSFLAKSTLFTIPVAGFLLRTLEALPLYRRVDAGENMALNQRTFAACFELLRQNRCIALFPEGISHSSTRLLPLKTGAARIALGALAVGGEKLRSLRIVPVGLYYTSKTSFRSEALLRFGLPFEVLPVMPDKDGQPPREAVLELSEQIDEKLREVTLNVENADAFEVIKRTEQLFSSVYESINFRVSLAEEFDLRRRFAAQFEKIAQQNPAQANALAERIENYESQLRKINLASEHLSVVRHSIWFVFRHFLLRVGIILALSPLIIVGAIIHFPAYLLCLLLSRTFRFHGIDDSGGTIKIVAAIALMPLTWLIIAGIVFYLSDWRFAVAAFPAMITCGYAALRGLEEAIDLRGWFKALWVLLRQPHTFVRLLMSRHTLHREISKISEQSTVNS